MSRTPNPYDNFFGLNSSSPASPAVEAEADPEVACPPQEPEPEYRYPAWALSIQKANCLLETLHDHGPKSIHEVLGPLLDAQDLEGFKDALNAIARVAMAVTCMREALPYLRDENPELVKNVENLLAWGELEHYDTRQRFLQVARVAWSARLEQLGGLAEEMLAEEGLG